MGKTPEPAQDEIANPPAESGDGGDADLRVRLRQAEERLATYQGFDRDIAENVRRSSELMLEAMQVRERVEHDAARLAGERQTRLVSQLDALESDLAGVRDQVAGALERLAEVRQQFGDLPEPDPPAVEREAAAGSTPDEETGDPVADAQPAEEEVEDDAPAGEEPAASRSVNLIAHGVPRAAAALALQAHLRALPQVTEVDAREFSSGVLRLQFVVEGELEDADLLGWEGDEQVKVVRHQDDAIELHVVNQE